MKSKGLIELEIENKWADRLNIIDYTAPNFSFNSENPKGSRLTPMLFYKIEPLELLWML